MRVDERGRKAGQRTVSTFQTSTNITHDYDALLHRRRLQRRNRAGALAASAVVAVVAVLSVEANLTPDSMPEPMQPTPGLDIGDLPVWYDAEGLHRGNVVEQFPEESRLSDMDNRDVVGALALVRSGALYQDPGTRSVWFHPWGGEPRIVGDNVVAGPGGDPEGDTAAWFDGSELVVYDTAENREISRTSQPNPAQPNCLGMCDEHYAAGSKFLLVSDERVVWSNNPGGNTHSHDVTTGITSVIEQRVIDFHDDLTAHEATALRYRNIQRGVVVRMPDGVERLYPDLEPRARLSPDGSYLLGVELTKDRHGAAIVDVKTGEMWRAAGDGYHLFAWSYGDIALVQTEEALLACDASRRTCERLPAGRSIRMPTT